MLPTTEDDEDTEQSAKVMNASFADPYLLLSLDDNSVKILEVDKRGELDEVEMGHALQAQRWTAGRLYKEKDGEGKVYLFLLNISGSLQARFSTLDCGLEDADCSQIFDLPNLQRPAWTAESFTFLPPILSSEIVNRRAALRESVVEILVADIGDRTATALYLVVSMSTYCQQ